MPSIDELQDKIRDSINVVNLSAEIAKILQRFEKEQIPIIYDQEHDYNYLRYAVKKEPEHLGLLRKLGFINDVGKAYDWDKIVLNEKAKKMYERLKVEGYYADEDCSKL